VIELHILSKSTIFILLFEESLSYFSEGFLESFIPRILKIEKVLLETVHTHMLKFIPFSTAIVHTQKIKRDLTVLSSSKSFLN